MLSFGLVTRVPSGTRFFYYAFNADPNISQPRLRVSSKLAFSIPCPLIFIPLNSHPFDAYRSIASVSRVSLTPFPRSHPLQETTSKRIFGLFKGIFRKLLFTLDSRLVREDTRSLHWFSQLNWWRKEERGGILLIPSAFTPFEFSKSWESSESRPIEIIRNEGSAKGWIIVGPARVRLSGARASVRGAGRGGAAFEIAKIARCAA